MLSYSEGDLLVFVEVSLDWHGRLKPRERRNPVDQRSATAPPQRNLMSSEQALTFSL